MPDPLPSQDPAASHHAAPETPATGDYRGPSTAADSSSAGAGPGPAGGRRGPFLLLGEHARGGLGQVSRARDEKLGRTIALKEIRPDRLSPQARRRFLNEAMITGQLEHPGVVPIYQLGEDGDGRPFYAMRFIEGRTLAEAIQEHHRRPTPLGFRELLQRFAAVCQTLAYAHSRGVIHRDLKPANVMLGEFGETLVMDWGLAKRLGPEPAGTAPPEPAASPPAASAADSGETRDWAPRDADGLTQAGEVLGTPAYMAPEQAEGDVARLGPAADVYALGTILYEILAGGPPAGGPGLPLPPDAPRPLAAVCRKAMAPAIGDRYPGAADLARDVECYLADEPVTAYREPWSARARRWLRKRRALVSSAAAVLVVGLVALAAGLVVVAGLNRRLDAQNRRLDQANADLRAANEAEKAERERATREALTAVAVTHFLTDDLLFQAAPEMNPVGSNLSVRQLLDRAARKIEDHPALVRQPEVEATVRFTLGETYRQLGDYSAAEKQFRRAFELRRQALGMNHQETLVALNNLALTVKSQRKLAEAEPLYRQALTISSAALGPDDRTTLTALSNLAQLLLDSNKPDEAEPLLKQCLEARERALGERHQDTLVSLNNLAVLVLQRGRWAEAEPLLRRTLALRREVLTDDHPDTLITAHNLAVALAAEGKAGEAELLYRESAERSVRVNGPRHPVTLRFTSDLSGALTDRGKAAEAVGLLRDVVRAQRETLPAGQRDLGLSLGNLGRALTDTGKAREAEPVLREAVAILRKTLPPGHWIVAHYESCLGACLAAQARYGEAERLLLEDYRQLAAAGGAPPPRVRAAAERVVRLYEAWGKRELVTEWRKKAGS